MDEHAPDLREPPRLPHKLRSFSDSASRSRTAFLLAAAAVGLALDLLGTMGDIGSPGARRWVAFGVVGVAAVVALRWIVRCLRESIGGRGLKLDVRSSSGTLRPGEQFIASWRLGGPLERFERLEISLEARRYRGSGAKRSYRHEARGGFEHAQILQTHVLFEELEPQAMRSGRVAWTPDEDLIKDWNSKSVAVFWVLAFRGEARGRPDFLAEYELRSPRRRGRRKPRTPRSSRTST